jgi:hypothetical protein
LTEKLIGILQRRDYGCADSGARIRP